MPLTAATVAETSHLLSQPLPHSSPRPLERKRGWLGTGWVSGPSTLDSSQCGGRFFWGPLGTTRLSAVLPRTQFSPPMRYVYAINCVISISPMGETEAQTSLAHCSTAKWCCWQWVCGSWTQGHGARGLASPASSPDATDGASCPSTPRFGFSYYRSTDHPPLPQPLRRIPGRLRVP